MSDHPVNTKPTYPGHHWGALAEDPWMDIAPDSEAWRAAIKRAWLRDGGTEAEFRHFFERPVEHSTR